MTAPKPRAAPKPTAAAAVAARLRERLPEPVRRRLPPWYRARPWTLLAAGATAVLVATGSVFGINLLLEFDRHPTVPVDTDPYEESYFAKGPRNVLVLGSDSRTGLTPEEQVAFGTTEDIGGERSDTIILMHIDPRREKAVVIHFPRDLRVEIPDHGTQKINAAYTLGGPNLAVRTVRELTGLPIHNYIEVNLAAFQDLIEAVGGVRICVDRPMFDELAGLDLPRKGCYTLQGEQALAFARARHIEGDLVPDFSRIARQQQLMRALMNRVLSVGSLLSSDVIEQAVQQVKTDERLSGADLILLGSKLRELSEEDPSGARTLDFRVVPGVPQTIDGISYVVPDADETLRLFQALRGGTSLGNLGVSLASTLPSPGVIRVRVLAVGSSPDAEEAEALLRRAGFIVLQGGAAPAGSEESEILFKPGADDRAEVLGGYFPGLPRSEASASILGNAEVVLVVGENFRSVIDE
jgi:LCP family protein required for cell wall assembly